MLGDSFMRDRLAMFAADHADKAADRPVADLPWHPGDHAVTADGWRAVVIEVGEDGVPVAWVYPDRSDCEILHAHSHRWPADAVPCFDHVGTAAAWMRSCAEVVARDVADVRDAVVLWRLRAIISDAHPVSPFSRYPDPTLTARAVEATRAYLATLETR